MKAPKHQVRPNGKQKHPAKQAANARPRGAATEGPVTLVFTNANGDDLGGCELTPQEWACLQRAASAQGRRADDLLIEGMDRMLAELERALQKPVPERRAA